MAVKYVIQSGAGSYHPNLGRCDIRSPGVAAVRLRRGARRDRLPTPGYASPEPALTSAIREHVLSHPKPRSFAAQSGFLILARSSRGELLHQLAGVSGFALA